MDNNNGKKGFKFWQLLGKAEELVGQPINSSLALEFLSLFGLPEKAEYSQSEAQQFFSICDQVLNQGKSLTQLRTSQTVEASGNSAQKKSLGVAQGLAQS
ncbi:MAG: hypothetical protein ACRDEA_09775, partial [Microcystaceae cyanobacterium]